MDPRLLQYYNRELQHLREMGGEFAKEFPKIAGRLGLEGFECADPYVERLLEGFSFMAARVQLKIDAEFPRLTQHLLGLVYPHCTVPTPSMVVAQFRPSINDPALGSGFPVPRGTTLRSVLGKGEATACEYRTAHAIEMWPLEITEARFFTFAGELGGTPVAVPPGTKGGLRLRFRAGNGFKLRELAIERLPLHIRGADSLPMDIHEALVARCCGGYVLPGNRPAAWQHALPARCVRASGFAEDQALLPYTQRSFQGYRLLQEAFAFPQRLLFIDIEGLRGALARCGEKDREFEIVILLTQADLRLEQATDAANFQLHCTPAINLVQKRAERIHLNNEQAEYHVVVDRTRPLDYEVYSVDSVTGYGSAIAPEQEFHSFYTANDFDAAHEQKAFYQLRRQRRMLSERQRRQGVRSSYIGSETYISLVDAREAPHRGDLRQLGLSLWCTNRDLPLQMSVGVGTTDFTVDIGGPIEAIRCVAGPSRPIPSVAEGQVAWRLVSHLSLNYLSLLDTDARQGPLALRELLRLYAVPEDAAQYRQIEGVRSLSSRPITRRIPGPGPITFGRGLEITVTFDEAAYEGAGVFLLGSVLEQFFAKYVAINTFTETVIRSLGRGEIMRWPARLGQCHVL
jgi:type VI secretion system protein ImpG